ncbi:hypothetical protein K0M31_014794 [Melipona bicolor]|uniref:Uncharacterized protein n=1 Tax=Melipona bicolor TaxID=60889 RepID=A0AA40KFU2_9HYME|nr:hypothetical protein K0M31_014794 [Melipona bicolor]
MITFHVSLTFPTGETPYISNTNQEHGYWNFLSKAVIEATKNDVEKHEEQGSFGRLSETRWSTGSGLKYSRPGCGNLWLALGLDTRSLDPPWLWFGTLAKAIRQRHNGGHKSGSHAPKPRTRRPHADHGPQPSIIRPRVPAASLSVRLQLSLHADFVRYCCVHPSPTSADRRWISTKPVA